MVLSHYETKADRDPQFISSGLFFLFRLVACLGPAFAGCPTMYFAALAPFVSFTHSFIPGL